MGAVSDRIGRRPVLIAFAATAVLTAYPAMAWLAVAPSFSKLLIVELWFSFMYAGYNGAMVVYLTEIVPVAVRTAGIFAGLQPRDHHWWLDARHSHGADPCNRQPRDAGRLVVGRGRRGVGGDADQRLSDAIRNTHSAASAGRFNNVDDLSPNTPPRPDWLRRPRSSTLARSREVAHRQPLAPRGTRAATSTLCARLRHFLSLLVTSE